MNDDNENHPSLYGNSCINILLSLSSCGQPLSKSFDVHSDDGIRIFNLRNTGMMEDEKVIIPFIIPYKPLLNRAYQNLHSKRYLLYFLTRLFDIKQSHPSQISKLLNMRMEHISSRIFIIKFHYSPIGLP
jgi:hypothetical protein